MVKFKTLLLCLCLILCMSISTIQAQQSVVGDWKGSLSIATLNFEMFVHFTKDGDSLSATIDIPQQGARGLALSNISFDNPKVHFELQTPAGPAVFDGNLEGEKISGKLAQAGMEGSFELTPGVEEIPETKSASALPVTYNIEEVEFNNGDIKLAGTLTLPKKPGKHPVIVLISGSGAQNRDNETLGFKVFHEIADYFTRLGVAVLRYDDRGVGGSTGSVSKSTTEDFAGDAVEAVNFLKARDDINPAQIGLLGHGEGGMAAPMAAARTDDVAFIILMSAPGYPGKDILMVQNELTMRANGATREAIDAAIENNRKLYDLLTGGAEKETVIAGMMDIGRAQIAALPEATRKAIPDPEKYLKGLINQQYAQLSTPWFKFYMEYDPAPALEKVKCPVLMVFGGLDTQVPAEVNRDKMVEILQKSGNADVTNKIFRDANHLYQRAKTGSPQEYASLGKEFVPGFLDYLIGWTMKYVDTVK